MDLHRLLDPVKIFGSAPKRGLIFFLHFLSDPQKLNLNILNMARWSIIHKQCFRRYTAYFFELKKRGFKGSLRSDFNNTIDQSNVNGFSWIFSSLIIKINYPHMSGGPKGPLSPPLELEVRGRRPLYLLLLYICNITHKPFCTTYK